MNIIDKFVKDLFFVYTFVIVIVSSLIGFGFGRHYNSIDVEYDWHIDFNKCQLDKENLIINLSVEESRCDLRVLNETLKAQRDIYEVILLERGLK